MITLLVGQRGTGKTSLLERIGAYVPEARRCDLDAEIEKRSGRSIPEIFAADGEAAFRKLEGSTLAAVLQESAGARVFVALGAGFEGPFPAEAEVVWVRRSTDVDGRIFLDRPRLDAKVSPLEEFEARRAPRELRFREIAHRELVLREGARGPRESERLFFTNAFRDLGGMLTLKPEQGRRGWGAWLQLRLGWGLDAFEVRDDLLAAADLEAIRTQVPPARLLLSARPGAGWRVPHVEGARHDWDVALGEPPFAPEILSSHCRDEGESLEQALARLESAAARYPQALLKAALPVTDLKELAEGDAWRAKDPARRAFLPMSPDGRWNWYRLLRRQPLAFLCEGEGSAPDQPTLLEWADATARGPHFAAVLGDPVRHSWTPLAHEDFFAKRGMPVFAVRVTEDEWKAGGLEALRRLGLRAAAVTAPLKLLAFDSSGRKSRAALELESVNTLAWDEIAGEWCGDNTDLEGFLFAVRNVSLQREIAVWGGGGTLAMLRKVLARASFYSARTGDRRHGPGVGKADYVVWACGPKASAFPPHVWEPKLVFDLDYRDNSLGRDYARSVGARYVSGRPMFERQAKLQRVFWRRVLG